jgi:hypothetical protein
MGNRPRLLRKSEKCVAFMDGYRLMAHPTEGVIIMGNEPSSQITPNIFDNPKHRYPDQ